jgi:hypothetical protein
MGNFDPPAGRDRQYRKCDIFRHFTESRRHPLSEKTFIGQVECFRVGKH